MSIFSYIKDTVKSGAAGRKSLPYDKNSTLISVFLYSMGYSNKDIPLYRGLSIPTILPSFHMAFRMTAKYNKDFLMLLNLPLV